MAYCLSLLVPREKKKPIAVYFSPQNEENLDKVVYSVSPRGNTFPVGKPHVCSVAIYMTSGDLVHE